MFKKDRCFCTKEIFESFKITKYDQNEKRKSKNSAENSIFEDEI